MNSRDHLIIIAFILATLSALSCARKTEATAVYSPGDNNGSIVVDSLTRTFIVHIPPGYSSDTPVPLVLLFHGGGGSGEQMQESSQMDIIADREGFITVYPDGTGRLLRTWNGGRCCGYAERNDIDDVKFVSELLDHLESALSIDATRVYAAGMSNGAIMCYRLACELSDCFAAIGPVAGTMMTLNCTPSGPVSVIHVHGTDDAHVPWYGGVGCGISNADFTSVPDTIEFWKNIDAITGEPSLYLEMGDGVCGYQGTSSTGADVVLCTVYGGGHAWHGGAPRNERIHCDGDGFQSATFNTSEVLWKFFFEHPKR